MNSKEIGEIRRRLNPEKTAVSRIYGCYVNKNGEIISQFDESVGIMPQEDSEKYISLMKKTLSGSPDKNLLNIEFSPQQVMHSEECALLLALRDSKLADEGAREALFGKITENVHFEDSNYLILLCSDVYDVPYRAKDGEAVPDASDEVFSYFICSICPVKDGKDELLYVPDKNAFHSKGASQIVAAPELGFMYPAFNDRHGDIYGLLFYSKSADEAPRGIIEQMFGAEVPPTAAEQKNAFREALCETLEGACSFDTVQTVHEALREKIEENKESGEPEPPEVSPRELADILTGCGVSDEKAAEFCDICREKLAGADSISPENIINLKSFEIKTADITLRVDPEKSYLIEERIIDGRKYLLLPADGTIEVNGLPVKVEEKTE